MRSSDPHTKMWIIVTIVIAIVTLGLFFAERAVRPAWTCTFAGHTITIGNRLTDDAQAYRSKIGGEVTCDHLLADYGGDALQVWEKEGSERHYLVLSALMIGLWLGAATCMISVTQAIRCATAGPDSREQSLNSAAEKKSKKTA
jgi:hypothetical protein